MSFDKFRELITAYAWTTHDGRREAIGDGIWDWYGAEKSVLVVDLCGFSRSSKDRKGILNFLALIRRMQAAAPPLVWLHKGAIVKMEADNCFAVFDTPKQAVSAALDLVAASQTIRREEHLDLQLCCGIEHGDILYLKDEDFFGAAVNDASRLGEDIAQMDEILVGPVAAGALGPMPSNWRAFPHSGGEKALNAPVINVRQALE